MQTAKSLKEDTRHAGEISFTDDHKEKIEDEDKTSTVRTLKQDNLYPVNASVTVKGSDIELKIVSRDIVVLGPDTFKDFDQHQVSLDREELASTEGFESFENLIDWLEGGNPMGWSYSLPQTFFRYRFVLQE